MTDQPLISSNNRSIEEKYGKQVWKEVRTLNRKQEKLVKAICSVEFLKTCVKHEKLPNFTAVNLASADLNKDTRFVNKIRWTMTEKELQNKNKIRAKLENEVKKLKENIARDITDTKDWAEVLTNIERKAERWHEEYTAQHTEKLSRLGVDKRVTQDTTNVTRRKGSEKIDKFNERSAIFNFSNKTLSEEQKNILSKGLSYGIKAKRVDEYDLLARFEQLAKTLEGLEMAEEENGLKAPLNNRQVFLQKLQTMAFEFLKLANNGFDNLTANEKQALDTLAEDKSIVICKADKGNSVVIQNVVDYKAKVMKILNDTRKFKRLNSDPTVQREEKLIRLLRKLKKEGKLENQIYKRVYPCGSRAGVMYGLPKVHKRDVPVRPIISAVRTYSYGLAKYLDEILKPLTKNRDFMLKDTFDFVNRVSSINNSTKTMVSYDVESLFTNIPIKETIEIILNRVFKDGVESYHDLERDDLKILLTICTQESHFQFDGVYYEQIDGVAMGSPLGPLFANVFMDEFEHKHVESLKEIGLDTWLRYVDDVFALVNDRTSAIRILEKLNTLHRSIKFTIEHETNDGLPFLDTRVVRSADRLYTTLYHKPTFTGIYLNWTSLTAKRYKIGMIFGLLQRARKICSRDEDFEVEKTRLRSILKRNDYPDDEIEKVFNRFSRYMANRNTPHQNESQQHDVQNEDAHQVSLVSTPTESASIDISTSEDNSISAAEDERFERFIVLPFVSRKAEAFSRELIELVETHYPAVKLTAAFQSPRRVKDLFPFKDGIKDNLKKSCVVYRLTCSCGSSYIGETDRILSIRVKEHRKKGESACRKHLDENPNHRIAWDDVEVIDSASTRSRLRIKETLHILRQKPELNIQYGTNQSKHDIRPLLIASHNRARVGVTRA
jgi:predicted GIY-YIG superfamily endonuclease